MSSARHRHENAEGPAGWIILLGLMVLALVIAGLSKGCGDSADDPVGSSTTTTPTTGTSTSTSAGQTAVAEIKTAVDSSGGIQFITGSANLTDASKGTLDTVAGILGRNPKINVNVDGHTDTQGEPEANMTLSKRRAQAVVDYLASKGIATNRMNARGFGETAPLVPNDTTEDLRKQNRRVEFKLSG